jgi:lipopolysaccharide export system permease protein
MKFNSIVNRYVFIEMIPPFVINVVFFTFVLLMTKILDITNLMVNYNISVSAIFLMLFYTAPYFLVYVIPMSIMIAVLLTFLRVSSDNEIIALKSSGVSICGLLPPVFLFCFAGCLLTAFMTIHALPWGRIAAKELTREIAASNLDIGLKERTFNGSFKDVMLYVSKIDPKSKELKDVFIEDQRKQSTSSTVVAPRGKLFSRPDELIYVLRLYNGTINQVGLENRSAHSIMFDTYDIRLDMKRVISASKSGPKRRAQMSNAELRDYLKAATRKDDDFFSGQVEYYRRFSLPFACLALGFLAVPLGLMSSSTKRSFGLGLGLVFFMFFYLMLSVGTVLGEVGIYPPLIAMWLPNAVTGAIGLYLFIRILKERPLRINFLSGLFYWWSSLFTSRIVP